MKFTSKTENSKFQSNRPNHLHDCTKQCCLLQLPIPYYVSLIMVAIISHVVTNSSKHLKKIRPDSLNVYYYYKVGCRMQSIDIFSVFPICLKIEQTGYKMLVLVFSISKTNNISCFTKSQLNFEKPKFVQLISVSLFTNVGATA